MQKYIYLSQFIQARIFLNLLTSISVLKLQPLLEFDQTEFFYGFGENVFDDDPVMDSIGYYYIPKACRIYGHKCLLHFYFHGCMTSRDVVGPNHVLNSGFLEVAETNGIIMIFPQTRQSVLSTLRCWDVYGYTGDFFGTNYLINNFSNFSKNSIISSNSTRCASHRHKKHDGSNHGSRWSLR